MSQVRKERPTLAFVRESKKHDFKPVPELKPSSCTCWLHDLLPPPYLTSVPQFLYGLSGDISTTNLSVKIKRDKV